VKSIKNFNTRVKKKNSPLIYSQEYMWKMQVIFLSGVKVMINTIWGKVTLLRTTNNNKDKIYCDAALIVL